MIWGRRRATFSRRLKPMAARASLASLTYEELATRIYCLSTIE